jgi:hypothetical protein
LALFQAKAEGAAPHSHFHSDEAEQCPLLALNNPKQLQSKKRLTVLRVSAWSEASKVVFANIAEAVFLNPEL